MSSSAKTPKTYQDCRIWYDRGSELAHGIAGSVQVIGSDRALALRIAAACGGVAEIDVVVKMGSKLGAVAEGTSVLLELGGVPSREDLHEVLQEAVGGLHATEASPESCTGVPAILGIAHQSRRAAFGGTNPHWTHCLYPGFVTMFSSIKANGIALDVYRLPLEYDRFRMGLAQDGLRSHLEVQRDANIVLLSMMETDFPEISSTAALVEELTDAWVVVGGQMATDAPQHTFVHMPAAHFVVRGLGEEIVPILARVLGDSRPSTGLSQARIDALRTLPGVLFHHGDRVICSHVDQVALADQDAIEMDFSLLVPDELRSFLKVFTSRGCPYACTFCSSFPWQRYHGSSAPRVRRHLQAYKRRIAEVFASEPTPPFAGTVDLRDNDMMVNGVRAAGIFEAIRDEGMQLWTFQTSIRSLMGPKASVALDALDPALFHPESVGISIGTEAFCDSLVRLYGKGFTMAQLDQATERLFDRGLRHLHYSIPAHKDLDAVQFWNNLTGMVRLLLKYGALADVSGGGSALIAFFGTETHLQRARAGTVDTDRILTTLRAEGYPEFDYPCVREDRVHCGLTRRLLARMVGFPRSSAGEPAPRGDLLRFYHQLSEEYAEWVRGAPLAPHRLDIADLRALAADLPRRVDELAGLQSRPAPEGLAWGGRVQTSHPDWLAEGLQLAGWKLERLLRGTGTAGGDTIAVFARDAMSFRLGVAPRDDSAPRFGASKSYNLYYQLPLGQTEARALGAEAQELMAAVEQFFNAHDF